MLSGMQTLQYLTRLGKMQACRLIWCKSCLVLFLCTWVCVALLAVLRVRGAPCILERAHQCMHP